MAGTSDQPKWNGYRRGGRWWFNRCEAGCCMCSGSEKSLGSSIKAQEERPDPACAEIIVLARVVYNAAMVVLPRWSAPF